MNLNVEMRELSSTNFSGYYEFVKLQLPHLINGLDIEREMYFEEKGKIYLQTKEFALQEENCTSFGVRTYPYEKWLSNNMIPANVLALARSVFEKYNQLRDVKTRISFFSDLHNKTQNLMACLKEPQDIENQHEYQKCFDIKNDCLPSISIQYRFLLLHEFKFFEMWVPKKKVQKNLKDRLQQHSGMFGDGADVKKGYVNREMNMDHMIAIIKKKAKIQKKNMTLNVFF